MPLTLDSRRSRLCAGLLTTVLLLAVLIEPAAAQAKNPFSVGISEGGGSASGVTGWLLAQQAWLEHRLALGVRAAKLDTASVWPLVVFSLVYGVFHAAGPGHGKAVLSSYMVANERALRRGIVLSFAAAACQGIVAVCLIGVLTLLIHATAQSVKATASWVETASFLAVVALGLQLVWRKGRALTRIWRRTCADLVWTDASGPVFVGQTAARVVAPGIGIVSLPLSRHPPAARFACRPADADHSADCPHCLGPDPRTLLGERFDLRQAIWTVLAAGLRPCSGAILVLVFAVAQGSFIVGALSVAAMSIGVAVTTSLLASGAVLFKGAMRRIAGRSSPRAALAGAIVELAAAGIVLAVGTLLLAGYAVSGMS